MMMILIFQQCMKILILPIYVLAYFGLWDPICKKTFPVFLKAMSKLYNIRMHKKKEMLFKNLRDFADASGKLHLLEIGVGPGTNFQFYPPNSHITCMDYNPNFRNILLESMAQNTHLQFENFVVTFAEDISLVPDGSVDVVVGTLVLCSVNNTQAVLKEILRVLRPGDSGDLLACYFPEASKYYLIGITSSGVGCGRPKFPGLYVRAASYKK